MSFPAYSAYQATGADWLGDAPSHWRIVPLWSLFNRAKRTGFPEEELLSVYRDYGVIPKSTRDDNFNKPSDDLGAYQLVEVGDLAINKMKAWQGSVAISDYRGIVSPAYHVYQGKHKECPRYLHYLFRCSEYITGYLANSKGIRVNQWDLEPQQHSRMSVLLPSYNEQEIIAAFLDHETTKIDALIAEQQRLIELLKEKRQAVISHAVTKGLNPNAPMKDSGVEWLGEVPAHWRVMKFVRCVQIAEGQVDPRISPYREMVLIAPNHVESGTGRLIGMETAEEQGAESGKYFCNAGDVVYSKIRPALRKACLAPVNGLCSADMYPLRATNGLANTYLLFVILSEPFSLLAVLESERVAMPKINREALNEVFLTVPPEGEQEAICLYVFQELGRIDHLLVEAGNGIELLRERRAALISAAVTGKIDVRKWRLGAKPATSMPMAAEEAAHYG